MTFPEFLNSLTKDELSAYAKQVGTSVPYITVHLKHARKTPRPDLMEKLWEKSNGRLSRQAVLDHFFPKDTKAA